MIKRIFDIVASAGGLVIVSPILLFAAAAIKLESRGPVFFTQERIGRNFRRFRILKFRSMTPSAGHSPQITARGDRRVTSVGKVLRKSKFDELPQLFNVLRGDMSLVGPRPEVPQYVDLFRSDYEEILTYRPGITDLASILYVDEESVLAAAADAEREYLERVLPEKIRLGKEYVRRSSLLLDLKIITATVLRIVRPHDRASSSDPLPRLPASPSAPGQGRSKSKQRTA
jgi:lipopolysaccharide/colanic/teichoic acid biosynthesis glycosyltransferase